MFGSLITSMGVLQPEGLCFMEVVVVGGGIARVFIPETSNSPRMLECDAIWEKSDGGFMPERFVKPYNAMVSWG